LQGYLEAAGGLPLAPATTMRDNRDGTQYVRSMRAEDVRAYKKRWDLVAEYQREELRKMTPAQKFEQLAMLVETARRLKWTTHTDAEIAGVRERWNRLAERTRG
jgi:hypothetical protein